MTFLEQVIEAGRNAADDLAVDIDSVNGTQVISTITLQSVKAACDAWLQTTNVRVVGNETMNIYIYFAMGVVYELGREHEAIETRNKYDEG